MKIFLKVREEYEQALMRDEEVVAGIPAYVPLQFPISTFAISRSCPLPFRLECSKARRIKRSIMGSLGDELTMIDIMRNGIGDAPPSFPSPSNFNSRPLQDRSNNKKR